MPLPSALPLVASLLLSACTMSDTPPSHEPAPLPPQIEPERGEPADDTCGAERVEGRLGQTYREALGEILRRESGAGALRVMRPGHAYTLEYRADRLSVRLDEEGVITAIRCG